MGLLGTSQMHPRWGKVQSLWASGCLFGRQMSAPAAEVWSGAFYKGWGGGGALKGVCMDACMPVC